MDYIHEFARERIDILRRAEARHEYPAGLNPWRHRRIEAELFLSEIESFMRRTGRLPAQTSPQGEVQKP